MRAKAQSFDGLPANPNLIDGMAKIAQKKGETLQGLIERVLRPYIEVDAYLEDVAFGLVTLPETTVELLLKICARRGV